MINRVGSDQSRREDTVTLAKPNGQTSLESERTRTIAHWFSTNSTQTSILGEWSQARKLSIPSSIKASCLTSHPPRVPWHNAHVSILWVLCQQGIYIALIGLVLHEIERRSFLLLH